MVADDLFKQLRQLKYNHDLYKMHGNLDKMISNISRLEVEYRRSKNKNILETPLKDLNYALNHLKNLILMAQLMD